MSDSTDAEGNWEAHLSDWEPWMQLIDWETLDWVADTPASVGPNGTTVERASRGTSKMAWGAQQDVVLLPMQQEYELAHNHEVLFASRSVGFKHDQLGSEIALTDTLAHTVNHTLQGKDGETPAPILSESHGALVDDGTNIVPSRKGHGKKKQGEGLTCEHPDCEYRGTFPRPWELQRHVATKHAREKPFWCPVVGCIKGSSAPAFPRPDKLTAHIRATHSKDGMAICPAVNCSDTPFRLDVLGVHIRLQHLHYKQGGAIGGTFRAIVNASSPDVRLCPLWFCKARVKIGDFPSHLLGHTGGELGPAAAGLVEEGYGMVKSECQCQNDDAGGEVAATTTCYCPVTSIELLCPVCTMGCTDRRALKAHIGFEHVDQGHDLGPHRRGILALVGTDALGGIEEGLWNDVSSFRGL